MGICSDQCELHGHQYISKLSAGQVVLVTGETISIGRMRREEVKNAYLKFVREDLEWR